MTFRLTSATPYPRGVVDRSRGADSTVSLADHRSVLRPDRLRVAILLRRSLAAAVESRLGLYDADNAAEKELRIVPLKLCCPQDGGEHQRAVPPKFVENLLHPVASCQGACSDFGGEAWKTWNLKMRDGLVKSQDDTPGNPRRGSWSSAGDVQGSAGGRLMITSLNLLTLEVYYRHLPLYQQLEK